MADGTSLSSIEFDSVDEFCDTIHRYDLLDILLFQKSLLCYLELLEENHLASTAYITAQATLIETCSS